MRRVRIGDENNYMKSGLVYWAISTHFRSLNLFLFFDQVIPIFFSQLLYRGEVKVLSNQNIAVLCHAMVFVYSNAMCMKLIEIERSNSARVYANKHHIHRILNQKLRKNCFFLRFEWFHFWWLLDKVIQRTHFYMVADLRLGFLLNGCK